MESDWRRIDLVRSGGAKVSQHNCFGHVSFLLLITLTLFHSTRLCLRAAILQQGGGRQRSWIGIVSVESCFNVPGEL